MCCAAPAAAKSLGISITMKGGLENNNNKKTHTHTNTTKCTHPLLHKATELTIDIVLTSLIQTDQTSTGL